MARPVLLSILAVTAVFGAACSSSTPATVPTSPSAPSRSTSSAALTTSPAAQSPSVPAAPSVPRPDHVVIVLEENKSTAQVTGGRTAPYIAALGRSGASFTQFYAETHPSQPNYLALFAGSTLGLTDDSCPHTYRADNLGAQAIAAGIGFAGYSESLPRTGYTGCRSGDYVRKHSPWVNFPSVPARVSRPFSQFPTDFSKLPAISFVIPNLQHDMHDGTVAQGDRWLKTNLGAYVTWARTHNSLLILTFDEDDRSDRNRIPTIIVGANVEAGRYSERADHYRLLSTLEAMFGLPRLGRAKPGKPITSIWR